MTKEEFITDKKKAIAEISLQQVNLVIASADEITKQLCKQRKSAFRKKNRNPKPNKQFHFLTKTFATALHLRQLEVQKHIIASRPFPKYPLGGPTIASTPEIVARLNSDNDINMINSIFR